MAYVEIYVDPSGPLFEATSIRIVTICTSMCMIRGRPSRDFRSEKQSEYIRRIRQDANFFRIFASLK